MAKPLPIWVLFVASVLVPFATLAVGFRLFYDSVFPEVAALVLTGAVFAYLRPRYAWLWLIGIGAGIALSEWGFPATPPAEHVARYGSPVKLGFIDLLKICAFPAAGTILGLAFWFVAGRPTRGDVRPVAR
jgi:hypothetical protein